MTGLIDTHVHVWDPRLRTYAWLAGTPLDRPMIPPEVDRADGATTGRIFVQADAAAAGAVAEARWVADCAWPELVGIVAGADLTARPDEIETQLSSLIQIPRVVGVRHLLQDLPTEQLPRFAPGLGALASRHLRFDACVRHGQLPALVSLLERVPEVTVVLDHLGTPPVDAGIASPAGLRWAAAITALAERPSTVVKVSGLTAESADREAFDRHADDFIAHAVDAVGADRCVLGRDWPVSARFGVGGRFAIWVDRVRRVVGEGAWPMVAAATARRVYLGEEDAR